MTKSKIEWLKKGVKIANQKRTFKLDEVKIESEGDANVWMTLTLTNGNKVNIQSALETMRLQISRFIRMQYGPYKLEKLQKGGMKQVPLVEELKKFENQFL